MHCGRYNDKNMRKLTALILLVAVGYFTYSIMGSGGTLETRDQLDSAAPTELEIAVTDALNDFLASGQTEDAVVSVPSGSSMNQVRISGNQIVLDFSGHVLNSENEEAFEKVFGSAVQLVHQVFADHVSEEDLPENIYTILLIDGRPVTVPLAELYLQQLELNREAANSGAAAALSEETEESEVLDNEGEDE